MRFLPYLLFCFFSVLGQHATYQFQHFGVNDGLSQSTITSIFQDKRGYLWLGTEKGLNKFNGSTFEIFMPSTDTLKTALVNQGVAAITEDKYGMIWIATRGGISKYNPKLKQFTNFTEVGDCEGCLAGLRAKSFFEDPPYMWVGTSAGLSRIHLKTNEVKGWWHTTETKNIPDIYSIRDIEKLDNGNLMLATHDGLVFYDIEKDVFTLVNKEDGLPDNGNGIQSIFKDSNGVYWLAMASSGVVKMKGDPKNLMFEALPIGKNGVRSQTVYDILEYPKGTLWFATHEGINLFNIGSETFRYLVQNHNDPFSISSNESKNLFIDRNNRMWVGGNFGLDVYDPYLNQFEMLTHSENGLAANNTSALFEDSLGAIWVGNVENGLTIIQKKNNTETFTHISTKEGLLHPVIYGIGEDFKGRIWVSTQLGINIIEWKDRSSKKYTITHLPKGAIAENKFPAPGVYSFLKDTNNTLWMSTHGHGLIVVDTAGNYRQLRYEIQDPTLQSADYVVHSSMDNSGRIWTSNSGSGIGVVENIETDTVFRKVKAKTEFNKIPVHATLPYKNSIFINTAEGIHFYENASNLLQKDSATPLIFNELNGLSDNTVNGVIAIGGNKFWVSTGNGLSLIDLEKETAHPYKNIAGRKNVEFSRNAALMTHDSIIYFGSTEGVIRFKPHLLQKNNCAPKLNFANLEIWNQSVPIGKANEKRTFIEEDIAFLNNLTLSPKDKVFSLTIDAVNFTLPSENDYAYKLEGFDETWTHSKNPEITYTNLDVGDYTLLAKAANNEGFWSNPIALQLTVLPPWWRTWWAYLLFSMLIIGGVYLLMKLRLQQERRLELARAQEREIFRKRSSRDFHDEAGTKITRISLITELAKLNNKNNPELQDYLSQIENNLQDLNNGMRDFIWTLDPTKDNAYDTLTRFTEFAGNFCEYAGIQFRSQHISENLREKELNMAERRHLLLILKEALNNSVKHGNPSIIDFIIESKPGKLIVILKDNGNGFDPLASKSGNGLNNMKERAQALGGALKINSEINGGTKLILSLETTRLGN